MAATTRTIDIALKHFPSVPPSLLDPATGSPRPTLDLRVQAVLHHAFLAKYGDDAPDPCGYEYELFLTRGPAWCFRGSGIGRDKEAKRNVSNELGKGFARWFCYEHLRYTYFCPLDDLLDKPDAFGWTWTRAKKGDLPDYVCGRTENDDIQLLEAKGRYRTVNFGTKGFQTFRDQIDRAALLDQQQQRVKVKGLVSVAQWATEESSRTRARLSVEDPWTDGRDLAPDEPPASVGRTMVVGHYVPILRALRLHTHADAVRNRRRLGDPVGRAIGVWECVRGPLKSRRFVGGILPGVGGVQSWPWLEILIDLHGPPLSRRRFPFFLGPAPRFFGLERFVFDQLIGIAQRGVPEQVEQAERGRVLEQATVPEDTGSLSLLRDGTVLGPVDYFRPIDIVGL